MTSERHGFDVDRRAVAQSPLAAYRSLLVRIAGAVIVCGFLTWMLPKPARYYWQTWAMAERSEAVWGVDVVQPLVSFLPEFFVSRAVSPVVLGPVLVAGVLALTFHYRR